MNLNLLEKYSSINGVSGHEQPILDELKKDINGHDEFYSDALGNAYFKFGTTGPKIMVAAHMDEIGFIVQSISDNGMINLCQIGGIDPVFVEGLQIVFANEQNTIAILKPQKQDSRTSDQIIVADIGASSKDEVISAGINIADVATFKSDFTRLTNNAICAKALDNRYGVSMLVDLSSFLKTTSINAQVYLTATTQEELGLRGANQIANYIIPEFAVILDVSNASEDKEDGGYIGNGPLIRHKDVRSINDQLLKQQLKNKADKANITTQDFFSKGATDSAAIQLVKNGVRVVNIGICGRYIHTANTIINTKDYEDSLKLTKLFLEEVANEN